MSPVDKAAQLANLSLVSCVSRVFFLVFLVFLEPKYAMDGKWGKSRKSSRNAQFNTECRSCHPESCSKQQMLTL